MDTSQTGNRRNPEAVRRNIIRVATNEFAENGLSGARVNRIAERTATSKRMIYYYFTDKEGLYSACLEQAYARVRHGEGELDLVGLSPDKALAELVAFTFDHHRKNPDFIRMVMIENIHKANFLSHSKAIRDLNAGAVNTLATIIERGKADGIFREELEPVELHWQISALSFFNVSNRPTFSSLFGDALYTKQGQTNLREHVVEMILRFACNKEESPN